MSFENVPIIRDLNGTRLRIASGGTFLEDLGSIHLLGFGIGAIPIVTGLTSVTEKMGHIHRSLFTFTNMVITTTDGTTNGAQGSQKIYTFPRGLILILGGTANLTITGDGTGVINTAVVVGAVGSVAPANDATLTSTEANMIPSTASTLTAGAGVTKGRGVTQTYFDNTTNTNSTQLSANLNFAMPDASSTANGTITVTGTVEICWINLGDN